MPVIPKVMILGTCHLPCKFVTFLNKWLDGHPRYRSNEFYLGGSSYAGKMIPLIAQYISEGNSGTEQSKQPVINLKDYLVGNPLTGSRFDDFNSKIPYSHGVGIISDQLYEVAMDNCKGDYINPQNEMCAEVLSTIAKLISEVDHDHILDDKCVSDTPGRGNDDALRNRFLSEEHIQPSVPSPHPTINCFVSYLKYSYRYYLAAIWANENVTRDALQIKEGTIGEWTRCTVGLPYTLEVPNSIPYHFNHTIRGYRVLVFSGDHDPGVPFLGTQRWVGSFNFSIVDNWRAWHVDGQSAGVVAIQLYDTSLNKVLPWVSGGWRTSLYDTPSVPKISVVEMGLNGCI